MSLPPRPATCDPADEARPTGRLGVGPATTDVDVARPCTGLVGARITPLPDFESQAMENLLARGRERDRDRPEGRGRDTPPGPAPLPPGGNLVGIIRLAAQLHTNDHLDEAAKLYEQVLLTDPDQAEALNLLGVLRAQQRRHEEAERLLEHAVRVHPDAGVHQTLGEVRFARKNWMGAVASFQTAIAMDPASAEPRRSLGHAWFAIDRFAEAAAAYRSLLARHPEDANAWSALGFSLIHLDMPEVARRAFSLAVRHDPADLESQHLLDALSGRTTTRAPDCYVRGLFDRYADTFDGHLQNRLQYQVPDELRQLVDEAIAPAPASLRAADLGCGTGLGGVAFADVVHHLVGVDLSPRMLDHCRRRDEFTEVVESAIEPWLARADDQFDLVIAADVFIYVGALETTLPEIHRILAPGGLVAFSTESATGEHYELRPSGRYAHSLPYLDGLAAAAGLDLVARRPAVIRVERQRPVHGHLTLLRRPA